MEANSTLLARIERALPAMCAALLKERGQAQEVPPEPSEQWALFRALVNTRLTLQTAS